MQTMPYLQKYECVAKGVELRCPVPPVSGRIQVLLIPKYSYSSFQLLLLLIPNLIGNPFLTHKIDSRFQGNEEVHGK